MAGRGSRIAAKGVIEELLEKNQREPYTNDSLMRHFGDLDKSYWEQGLSLVGFVRDSGGVAPFGFGDLNFTTDLFGRVGLIGSGAGDFEKFLRDQPSLPTSSHVNDLQRSLACGLMISGVFLSSEIASFDSLMNFYVGDMKSRPWICGEFLSGLQVLICR